jgi:hypothetical protein
MLRRARSFEVTECSDPKCGPHIVAMGEDDEPICEIVVPRSRTPDLIKVLQGILYGKVTEEDH